MQLSMIFKPYESIKKSYFKFFFSAIAVAFATFSYCSGADFDTMQRRSDEVSSLHLPYTDLKTGKIIKMLFNNHFRPTINLAVTKI